MPTSATGSSARPGRPAACPHRGFTLLEILLVLLIVAIGAALVAPSFVASMRPDAGAEARRLAQALRLALDEAALSGRPLRWLGYRADYRFEALDGEAWRPLAEAPFAPHRLPEGLVVRAASTELAADVAMDGARSGKAGASNGADGGRKRRPLAVLVLPPEGLAMRGWIELGRADGEASAARIAIGPGPGGIAPEAAGG